MSRKIALELLKIAKLISSGEVVDVNFSAAHIKEVMKSLKNGDKVEVRYNNPQRGGEVASVYTVNADWKEMQEAGMKRLSIGIIGRGTPHGPMKGRGGSITDYGDSVMFQPTLRTQVTEVISLKKI